MLAELLDYCTQVAQKNFKGKVRIVEIETAGKKPNYIAKKIEKVLKNKKGTGDHISYNHELKKFLGVVHART